MFPRRRRQQASISSFHVNAISDEKTIENTPLELTPKALMEQLYQAIQQYPKSSGLYTTGIIVYQDLNSWLPHLDTLPKNKLQLWRTLVQLVINLLNDFTDANVRALIDHGTYFKLGNMRRHQRRNDDPLSIKLIQFALMMGLIYVCLVRAINETIGMNTGLAVSIILAGLVTFYKFYRRSGITPLFIMEINAYLSGSLANHLRSLAQVPNGREECKALLRQCTAEQAFMGEITAEAFKSYNILIEDINKIIGSYLDIEDREKLIKGLPPVFIEKAAQERDKKRDRLRNEEEVKTISRVFPSLPPKAANQVNSFLDRHDKLRFMCGCHDFG